MSVLRTSRRGFLRGVAGLGAGVGVGTGLVRSRPPPAGASEPHGVGGTIVVVTLAGGVDGLSVVVPHADPEYRARRPTIAIAAPSDRHGAIDLGRGIGLHPALAPLFNTAGRDDELAIIGGVGVPGDHGVDVGHVSGRAFLDFGGPGDRGEGWATRLLGFEGLGAESAWSFGPRPHPVLTGMPGAAAGPRPGVEVGPHSHPEGAAVALRTAYGGESGTARAGAAAFDAAARWAGTPWTADDDRRGFGYPDDELGRMLTTVADMIRADRGLRIVAVDHEGYDTHVDQGDGRGGQLAHRLDRLARGLSAFWRHLGEARAGVVVVAVSELGRSIDENRAGGTEHGRATVALVIGAGVVGGFHGDLPALADPTADWPVSIDVRRVLADAAVSVGLQPWRSQAFPGLPLPDRSLGLLLSP